MTRYRCEKVNPPITTKPAECQLTPDPSPTPTSLRDGCKYDSLLIMRHTRVNMVVADGLVHFLAPGHLQQSRWFYRSVYQKCPCNVMKKSPCNEQCIPLCVVTNWWARVSPDQKPHRCCQIIKLNKQHPHTYAVFTDFPSGDFDKCSAIQFHFKISSCQDKTG